MIFHQFNTIKTTIADQINQAIKHSFDLKIDSYDDIGRPPKDGIADFTFPCFKLTKQTKSSPVEIAKQLAHQIPSAQAAGPYLNITLSAVDLAGPIIPAIINGSYYQQALGQSLPKTMIEFSQPNTHKEMHVGHMRNLSLGAALVNLHRYSGFETVSTTFPGDVGTHVAKCLWYFKYHNLEPVPEQGRGEWLGTLYTKAHNLLEEQKGSDQEDKNRATLTHILKELELGSGEYFDLWKETRQWSLDLMQSVYQWAGVEFDIWYWESDVDADSVALAKKLYKEGLIIKDKGALGVDLSDDKLGFCLLLKSDGTGLYATKDLELAHRKFKDYQIERNLYVVDNRQALHFKQVFKVLEKLGHKQAKDCVHIAYEMVELKDGAMSSRKGNIVPLRELISKMEHTIKAEYLTKYSDEWSVEEVDATARVIANGAIKYGMTKVDTNKKIIFDMNEWLRLDGDSGPYLQYVYARIQSILSKGDVTDKADLSLLKTPSERLLLNKLNDFNEIILSCTLQFKTHYLTSYLYELGRLFNSFYAEHKVISEDKNLSESRLALCYCVSSHIKQGLALLAIDVPERM